MNLDERAIEQALDQAKARFLSDAGEFLLETANRTAPIEEGTLIGSGAVTVFPQADTVVVSYDTPYAVRQHEDTRLRHDPGRRAKWLEHTAREEQATLRRLAADRIGGAL